MVEPLRYPVTFVQPEARVWPELRAAPGERIPAATLAARCVTSYDVWITRTFYELSIRGHAVTLEPATRPDRINVVTPKKFRLWSRKAHHFILCPRADGHRPMMANFVVVQNDARPEQAALANMPHWAQPGVLPRDPARRGVTCVGFKGRSDNLDGRFRDEAFLAALRALGVDLEEDSFDGLEGEQSWSDYRRVDALLAIRNLTVAESREKPASKLVNAWMADVPAILGPEPAFRALRRSPLDYIEARDPEEALAAIRRLRDDPALHRGMVENGRRRRAGFCDDAIAERWVRLFNERVGPAFERWRSTSPGFRRARHVASAAADIVARKYFRFRARSGPRLLAASPTVSESVRPPRPGARAPRKETV